MCALQFQEAERQAELGDEHLEHFFRHLWAAKEAALKARGDGLTCPPRLLSFSLPALLPLPAAVPPGALPALPPASPPLLLPAAVPPAALGSTLHRGKAQATVSAARA
jgi:4'-phosphopantetheinyl transferase superfamily